MAGSVSGDSGVGMSPEGISSGQRCQSGESLSEWRSSEQVENGTPSTSPPYWDTDDDDICGAKPSELYGKFTWKIEQFPQITKRELRSNAFEVGSYKWYILIYPQGCDVCNHLSLFLCVANHEKLLPGWSHFAQFTIAVVNKDPKKSKYSDTLHRFWKKEHDWGWKKFMELSKVNDGFIVSDTLVIKAQVQVIREKARRPFRCLDCQYRRELVRVYLSNVELICRRFVEEKRGALGKLIEDKVRWSSFHAFWFGVDQNARRHLSRDKQDAILKDVVKSFFIEKEVTSTLVMDSLYSGLRALECQNRNKKGTEKLVEMEETSDPIVFVEKDMFVLADDALALLERAAMEPLPPKDEKGPQNRTKEGSSGDDFNKDSIERDERRLTELGRRTVEIFVLAHIFSKIEAAYQDAVALRRQEELIREEEAAGQAETELKGKRGGGEKEKRAKKKQSKQKRSGRKGKDRAKDEKFSVIGQDTNQRESPSGKRTIGDISMKQGRSVLEKPIALEDISDASDTDDDVAETLQCDLEDRDGSLVSWDTETSAIHTSIEVSGSTSSLPVQNGVIEKKSPSIMDDSSSTCSTDSVPSVVMNGPYKGNSFPSNKCQTSPSRGKNQHKQNSGNWTGRGNDRDNQRFYSTADTCHLHDSASCCTGDGLESDDVTSLKDRIHLLEQHSIEKDKVVSLQKKLNIKDKIDVDRPPKQKTVEASFSPSSPMTTGASSSQPEQAGVGNTATAIPVREAYSNSPSQMEKVVPPVNSPQIPAIPKPEVQKAAASTYTPIEKKPAAQQVPTMSRPLSAPVVPAPGPNPPVVSVVQTPPLLSRSVSAAGRLGTDPPSSAHGYIPQSYRNAITGKTIAATSAGFAPRPSSSSSDPSLSYSQTPSAVASLPLHSPQISTRTDQTSVFGSVAPTVLHNQSQWIERSQQKGNGMMARDPYVLSGPHSLDIYGSSRSGTRMFYADEELAGVPPRQVQGPPDEFPHLDIINSLLEDDHNIGKEGRANGVFQGPNNRHHPLSRQFTYPGDVATGDVGSSANYCRFDWLGRHPDDGIGRMYSSSSGLHEGLRDVGPQVGLSGYMNRQMDGMMQNQWQTHSPDRSLFNMRNVEGDRYPFPPSDYTNLACGVNGYSFFRPANGR
ncbi:hypothetical protein AAC387_Pa08g1773 [Persea americana]